MWFIKNKRPKTKNCEPNSPIFMGDLMKIKHPKNKIVSENNCKPRIAEHRAKLIVTQQMSM